MTTFDKKYKFFCSTKFFPAHTATGQICHHNKLLDAPTITTSTSIWILCYQMFSSMIKVKKGEENGDWETELDCAAGRWVSVSKGTFFPQINPSFPWAKLVPNLLLLPFLSCYYGGNYLTSGVTLGGVKWMNRTCRCDTERPTLL